MPVYVYHRLLVFPAIIKGPTNLSKYSQFMDTGESWIKKGSYSTFGQTEKEDQTNKEAKLHIEKFLFPPF